MKIHHVAINVSDIKKSVGENVEIKTHRDGSHYLYLEDPDGNVLEKLYWDR